MSATRNRNSRPRRHGGLHRLRGPGGQATWSTRFWGAKPAHLWVEQPTKFDLVVNLTWPGEGAGPGSAAHPARPRRRGDRMSSRREFITLLGGRGFVVFLCER